MNQKISEGRYQFLLRESRRWVDTGIIDEAMRASIVEGYAVSRNIPAVVVTLGIMMIGAGVLSFVAANWQYLAPFTRVGVILSFYIGCVGGAYLCEKKRRRTYADVLMLLSGFVLLAGIALISQVFHIKGSPEGLLATWLIVYAPTFLMVKNLAIFILYEIVGLVYINMKYALFMDGVGYRGAAEGGLSLAGIFLPWQPLFVAGLIVAFSWHIWRLEARNAHLRPAGDEESKLKKFLLGGATRRIFLSNFMIVNCFIWMCILNSTGRSVLPCVLGVAAIGICVSLVGWRLRAGDLDFQGLVFTGVAGMLLSMRSVWHGWSWYHTYNNLEGGMGGPLLSSAALGAYLVWRIAQKGEAFSVFLFCALLMRWYFDMFYSFMSKSLFFMTGGVFLLAVAWLYRRWSQKRKTSLSGETSDA